jgi:hypothetical protein
MLITLTVDGWYVFCQFFFFSPRVTGAQTKILNAGSPGDLAQKN